MTEASAIETTTSSTAPSHLAQSNCSSKKYSPSRFNARATAPDGSLILYNAYSGHCCVIPSSAAQHAMQLLSARGFECGLDGLGQYLLKAGYLVEAGVDEAMIWDVAYAARHYRNDSLSLIVLPSEECNFRCTYCSQLFERGTMAPHIRAAIRRFISAQVPKLRSLWIGWFGGEPLLGYDVIQELAPFLQDATRDHEVSYASHITTNGYLLTPERVQNLLKWGVLDYQVTLDGLPEVHDTKRPLKEGGPTFARIMGNLMEMRRCAERFKVRVRVNFDRENISSLQRFFDFLGDQLESDPRFEIAFNPVGKWGGANDDRLNVFTDEVLACQAGLRDQARKARLPIESAMRRAKAGSFLCHATLAGGFVIGADGRLMKCTNFGIMPKEINVIGQLLDDGTIELDRTTNLKWIVPFYNHDPKCKKCFYLPVCRGGIICPAARVKGFQPVCPQERLHIRSLLLEYWKERLATDGGKHLHVQTTPAETRELQVLGLSASDGI